MYRIIFPALVALAGLSTGVAQAAYCEVSEFDASDLRFHNFDFQFAYMKTHNGLQHFNDPNYGCTMEIPLSMDRSTAQVVTDVGARAWWTAFTHFGIDTTQLAGRDTVTFRRITFDSRDANRRELQFNLEFDGGDTSALSPRMVVTYTETSSSGTPLSVRVVELPDLDRRDYWLRVDVTTNSGTASSSLGSTLEIRFVASESQQVLAGTSIALPAHVWPGKIYQGRLASRGNVTGRLSLCTAYPYQDGVPADYLVPPPGAFESLCRI